MEIVKITNRELEGKLNLLKKMGNKKLPIKVSYAIAKNIDVISKELKIFITERDKLINEYALKDENGNLKIEDNKYVFEDGKEEECNSKYAELLDIEVDMSNLRTARVDDLLNSDANLTANEIIELEFMLQE